VNPLICAAIFGKITQGKAPAVKIADATKATMAIVVILCLAALAGAQLLNVFGISLPAFQTAGGMVLVWMGFIMLRGNSSPTSAAGSATENDAQPADSSLSPLILFAASPGTITGVITLSVSHAKHGVPTTALVAVMVALSATWLIMVLASRTSGHKQPGLLHDVTTRFMGLIVLAMGVQFALAGLNEFFNRQ
jgi:multiple antibiotic resistance protein